MLTGGYRVFFKRLHAVHVLFYFILNLNFSKTLKENCNSFVFTKLPIRSNKLKAQHFHHCPKVMDGGH